MVQAILQYPHLSCEIIDILEFCPLSLEESLQLDKQHIRPYLFDTLADNPASYLTNASSSRVDRINIDSLKESGTARITFTSGDEITLYRNKYFEIEDFDNEDLEDFED